MHHSILLHINGQNIRLWYQGRFWDSGNMIIESKIRNKTVEGREEHDRQDWIYKRQL